jgi:uncharacterized membrane protein YdjX (TVP38/TMEM64 family)/Fe-S oxidoreductase
MNTRPDRTFRPDLQEYIAATQSGCAECGVCVQECTFLRKYGNPKRIADTFDAAQRHSQTMPFECTLCRLCTAVCPEGLDPAGLFLEMRREAVRRGVGEFTEHRPITGYEARGTSRRFTWYGLHGECDTIFFPGCSLAGTRPKGVEIIYERLRKSIPRLGIVFDCCLKPSHDLGRDEYFRAMFNEMTDFLRGCGVSRVLVACPNCRGIFATYAQGFEVETVYEALLRDTSPATAGVPVQVAVHDPCGSRFAPDMQQSVRELLRRQGLEIAEMSHSGRNTRCCGLGGSANFLDPELIAASRGALRDEAEGKRIITYCAGCAQALGSRIPTSHVIDILLEPEKTLAGKVRGARAPLTYLHRLRLKQHYKRKESFAVTRERTFIPGQEKAKKRSWKPFIFLALLAAAAIGVHLSGAAQYLRQEKLREMIAAYGVLAPVIYILVYSLAPVLFLPGLPLTIAGGILFGPVWGVVYTIFGATIGASLAFLVARYLARDWVASRLASPKWARFDEEVADHGWKVVAFTRLIPAFPFNLLNYAFGLTRISFAHYLLATFVCMLPACIAFIVFSSSLLDLIRGSVSPTALLGIGLIVLVSLIPAIYRRLKRQCQERVGVE